MNDDYQEALAEVGVATLRGLAAMELAQRRLHPPDIEDTRAQLRPLAATLEKALSSFGAATPASELVGFHERFQDGATRTLDALSTFVESPPAELAIQRVLASMHKFAGALEALYSLHRFPPIGRFFCEPAFHDRLGELDREDAAAGVGLHHSGSRDEGGGGERGQFCLYVPESHDGTRELPLVVALHGGSGNGRDFMWTWLREARGRGFLLLSPTARGSTWSLDAPQVDSGALRSMVSYVADNWPVKRDSVLLTGLSDGATFTLLEGLSEGSPFTALAPMSGVLHPACSANGDLERAEGRRIYLVHGALDWMFPVQVARTAQERLAEAGAELVYREVADLSHTYAREENDPILSWFDPTLALA